MINYSAPDTFVTNQDCLSGKKVYIYVDRLDQTKRTDGEKTLVNNIMKKLGGFLDDLNNGRIDRFEIGCVKTSISHRHTCTYEP